MPSFSVMPIDEWIKLIPMSLIGLITVKSSMDDDEFLISKGIEWASRNYAKTNSRVVTKLVTRTKDLLSP